MKVMMVVQLLSLVHVHAEYSAPLWNGILHGNETLKKCTSGLRGYLSLCMDKLNGLFV